MPAPGQAVPATSAYHVTFAADDVAGMEIVDIGARFDDFSHELVPNCHGDGNGALCPIVPFIDVYVGAADAGAADANQYVVDSRPRRFDFFQPEAGLAFALYQCLHDPF